MLEVVYLQPKALDLITLLKKNNVDIKTILTKSGQNLLHTFQLQH